MMEKDLKVSKMQAVSSCDENEDEMENLQANGDEVEIGLVAASCIGETTIILNKDTAENDEAEAKVMMKKHLKLNKMQTEKIEELEKQNEQMAEVSG